VATDHGDALDGLHAIGWLRLRRALGDDAGVMDPEAARYWYWQLGIPPRFGGSRWARAGTAEPGDEPPADPIPSELRRFLWTVRPTKRAA
jgi:hypothetical protein